MSPTEFLEADPGLIQELLEVVHCEDAVEIMQTDISKLNKATYSLLHDMGWGEDAPEEVIDREDERWLLG